MSTKKKVLWSGGYEQQFVDPAARDFECPLCLHVMREPTVTDCCGGHFCSGCILNVLKGTKQCPLCRRRKFKTLVNKAVERKIADLRVRCGMTGCQWEGPMRDVGAHQERETGDCGFVFVECPARCGSQTLRAHIPAHLRDHCPKREVCCSHCRYKATFDQMASDHWVACPNGCTIDAAVRFQRCRLDLHLSECPNQLVPCDFRDLGCDERIRRQDSFEHNTTKHLVMLYTLMLNMKKRLDAKDATIRQLEDSLSKEERSREALAAELKQKNAELRDKNAEVAALQEGTTTRRLECHVRDPSPSLLVHVMPRYAVYKTTLEWWQGHEFYTHPEGYRLCLSARIGTGPGAESLSESSKGCWYLCVRINIQEGRYDCELKWGREFKVTVGLLNQLADECHFVKTLEGELRRHRDSDADSNTLISDDCFIACSELEQAEETSVQFLKDDSVKFRICSVEFQ